MRRLITALVPVMASVATLSLVACGNDGVTSEAGAVGETVAGPSANPTTDVPTSTGESPVETVVPVDDSSLLIDSLPAITGPTVLWFWAPG